MPPHKVEEACSFTLHDTKVSITLYNTVCGSTVPSFQGNGLKLALVMI